METSADDICTAVEAWS